MTYEDFRGSDAPFWLHQGDCLNFMRGLPDKSCDVVITDPPYSEHVHAKSRPAATLTDRAKYPSDLIRNRDFGFAHITEAEINAAAEQFARLTKRWVLVFCNVELAHVWRAALVKHGLEYVRTGIWVKIAGPPQFSGDRPAPGYESIVIAHPPGKKRWNGGGKSAVWQHRIVVDSTKTPRLHKAQKPRALMGDLVTLFSDPGEIILDAFAGSGSTGEAAVTNERRSIMCERDPEVFGVMWKRCEAVKAQPKAWGFDFDQTPKLSMPEVKR